SKLSSNSVRSGDSPGGSEPPSAPTSRRTVSCISAGVAPEVDCDMIESGPPAAAHENEKTGYRSRTGGVDEPGPSIVDSLLRNPQGPAHTEPSPMRQDLQVAVVQLNSTEDRDANYAAAERLVRQAAAGGASLVVLPEYFNRLG